MGIFTAIAAAFQGLASLKGILEQLTMIASKISAAQTVAHMQSRIDALEAAVDALPKAKTDEERANAIKLIAQASNH